MMAIWWRFVKIKFRPYTFRVPISSVYALSDAIRSRGQAWEVRRDRTSPVVREEEEGWGL